MRLAPAKIWTVPAVILASLLLAPDAAAVSWDDAANSLSKLWDDNGNWSPDGDPDSLDVFIGNFANAANDTTLLDRFFSIDSLTITNGADVVNSTDDGATNDFELIVNGATSVSGNGSSIIIYGGDPDGLDTDTLSISSGASVILNSTTAQGTAVLEVDGGSGAANLDVLSGGTLTGTGRIDLESALSSPNTVLLNNGTITANTAAPLFLGPNAGTLQITANDVDARFDWDGGGNGVLQANGNQTLDIDVDPGLDAFSGVMNLNTGSTIDIQHGWELDSGEINANTAAFGLVVGDPNPGPAAHIAGAAWTMTGGTILLADSWDSLQFDSQVTTTGGTIENSGTVIFNNTATIGAGTDFQMNGAEASITINDGITVNIDDANFNPDGNGFATNVITVGDGGLLDLDVDFALADEDIDGTVNLNGGELNVTNTNGASADDNWRINSGTTVNVSDAVNTADLDGSNLEIFGTINVNANADLLVNPTSTAFRGAANINVAAGATLNVSGVSSYESGVSITGAGTFSPGTATIGVDSTATEDAVWATAFVNYDDGDHTINEGSSLTVNADSIESEGSSDGIDNDTTIEDGGVVTFNLTGGAPVVFDSGSTITYNGDSVQSVFLGDSSSPIEFHGTMNVNGDGGVEPRMLFDSATVNINDVGERLRLSGGSQTLGDTNTIRGATINGPGILQLDNGTALRGDGTINAVIDDNGSGDLVAEGGMLTLGGDIVDIGRLGTNGAAAILTVSNPWSTSATGEVFLNDGRLQGSLISNDGPGGIHGQGLVVAPVHNDTVIRADTGGTLTVDNFVNDWDGPTNGGTLQATAGSTLTVRDNAPFLFNGTVSANNAIVASDGFELEFDPASTLQLSNGGVYQSTHATDIGGTVLIGVGTNSRIEVSGSVVFESGSFTTLNGNLELANSGTVVQSGATFAGGGVLLNRVGRTLTLLDGADIGVLLGNRGVLVLGASPGQVTGVDFQQTAAGLLEIELQGTSLSLYDRMTLTGLAQVDGELDVSLIGGFAPVLGDSFTILSAAGGVSGEFSVLGLPALTPGLTWDVVYNPTFVNLLVTDQIDPDFNQDGSLDCLDVDALVAEIVAGANDGVFDLTSDGAVNHDDLDQWLADAGAVNLGSSYLDGDANLDGEVDALDFGIWNSHKFTSEAAWCSGDFTADGVIDGLDLLVWNANKFTSANSPAVVPEPSGLRIALLAMGMLLCCLRMSEQGWVTTSEP